MHIPVSLLEKNEAKFAMSPQQIEDKKQQIKTEDAIQLDGVQHAMQRKKVLAKAAPENEDIAYERYIGDIELLPINYLEIGYLKSKSVGRLRYFDLNVNRTAMASAFLISPDLVLTNHHVFTAKDSFQNALIDFDYAYNIQGAEATKIVFEIDTEKFFYTNKDLDFTIAGIKTKDITNIHDINERGFLVLNPVIGKIGTGDSATIIQFPEGGYQQIALRENKILDIERQEALIYQTDTAPGTSGSPVFNDQWQVIALHSAGVAKKDTQGNYIDKDNKIIPVVNGTIDSSRIEWVSNTGIRISSLVNSIAADTNIVNNQYVKILFDASYSDNKENLDVSAPAAESLYGLNNSSTKTNTTEMPITITTPDNSSPVINININIGKTDAASAAIVSEKLNVAASVPPPQPVANVFESKADDEINTDYSSCMGFDENFMGFKTPLPVLERQLQRQVASLNDNSKTYVLRYDHYSTIFHSVRKVPVVSMINVDGNPAERKDTNKRKDKWMRDNRIDIDIQLNDAFYSNSGFDKGHLSRREDAKWGPTPDEAEIAAQMTCMYTNACPQVPDLNRAGHGNNGLWGQLEKIVLEKGIEKEKGNTTRICVFNGPIFVNTDPVFKGVQVAMRFFKIIVWLNGKGEKKTTAFVLSQEDLAGGIQFEELQYDKEFTEHQCSVAYVEKLTGLTFTNIRDYDTSPRTNDPDAVEKTDAAGVESLILKHK
jgi:endonuclease G, mitochondrial